MLHRKTGVRREPWHTVSGFSRLAAPADNQVESQLAWFTQAVWQAAYDPAKLPSGLVAEAKLRLDDIGRLLKAAGKPAIAQ